jgi:hypothetical protein
MKRWLAKQILRIPMRFLPLRLNGWAVKIVTKHGFR